METKKIAKFMGLGIIAIVLVAFVSMGFIMYDIMSYTATGSQTLNPNGASVGNALVVYDPGITGTAKNVASVIASDLQAKGYTATIAGIKSSNVLNTTGYNVIVIGGPVYAGQPASSLQSYLSDINPPKEAKIGVFTTGSVIANSNNTAFVKKEIAMNNTNIYQIDEVMKFVNGNNMNQKAEQFVNGLLGQI
jgi:menaquinone-dependent protoporphyrinogen IX oxidase